MVNHAGHPDICFVNKLTLTLRAYVDNSAVTPNSRPYGVPTATQDAVESPWTQRGRSEDAEGRSNDPNDAHRSRLF